MTFDELCELEPRLRDLEADVRAAGRPTMARRERLWYGRDGFKQRLSRLVGFCRRPPGYVVPPEPAAEPRGGEAGLVIEPVSLLVPGWRARVRASAAAKSALSADAVAGECILGDMTAYDATYRHLYAILFPPRRAARA